MLKDDEARLHWETHVRVNGPLHRLDRLERAARQAKSGKQADIQRALRKIEEAEFQEWLVDKRLTGFAQFGDPFMVDPSWDD